MLKILARIAAGKPREVSTLLSRAYPFARDFSRYRLNTKLADCAIKIVIPPWDVLDLYLGIGESLKV